MLCKIRNSTVVGLAAAAACAIGTAGVASAQSVEYEDEGTPMIFGEGLAVTAGGGVQSFVSERMRDTTDVGGLWEVRVALGTRSWLGAEAAYVGTAQSIDAPIAALDATLVGTTFEVVGRFNILPTEVVRPYVIAGLGWSHYEVTGEDFTTASVGIGDSDDVMTIPLGAGVASVFSGVLADARFTFRPSVDSDLVLDDPNDRDQAGDYTALHSWDISARVGYEF
jgi:hypothetical protein